MDTVKITMLGTLPPLKGNAYYCWALSKELSKKIDLDFISFKKLYPEFLYPGGTLDKDVDFSISSLRLSLSSPYITLAFLTMATGTP